MSVWVCWVRYTVHLRGGLTVNGPNSRLSALDSTRTLTTVGPAREGTSISTGCLPLSKEGSVRFTGSGQFWQARVRVALVRPPESMVAIRILCSPWAVLGMSGETARLRDWTPLAGGGALSAPETDRQS